MTLGYFMFSLGAMFLYSAITNTPIRNLILGIPGPGQPPDIVPDTPTPASSGATTRKLSGLGAWGSAKKAVDSLTRGIRLPTMSTKRGTRGTSTGGVSDHWTGCKECFARDLGGTLKQRDRAAQKIMRILGQDYNPGDPLEYTGNYQGYRVQVLHRTNLGGDHFGHLHLGARKIGYEPA
jgi:hypothetical protein